MLWQNLQDQAVDLSWSFYGPVLIFVLFCALGVPVWAAIGACAVSMLILSEVLPLSLLGESLFDGIDAFALTAIPLFILTGDALVRTGLSRKFMDVAEAQTCWAKGGFGSATVLVPGIIFYGIFSGRLTPTEAGATAVTVTIIMGFYLQTLKLSDFPAMLLGSAKVNGVILPIIAFSLPLAQTLAAMTEATG